MKIHSSIESYSGKRPTVAMGIFDGVHPGHTALLRRIVELAHETGSESVVLTYQPHPRLVLKQDPEKLRLLTSLDEKVKLIEKTGIDHLIILPFTLELAALSAENFIREILIDKLDMGYLLAGYNHRFGKGGITIEELIHLSYKLDFQLDQFRRIDMGKQFPSSTKIRNLLSSGDILNGNMLLGYRYIMSGQVVKGAQRGRTLGYPTANMVLTEPLKLVPPSGVYACIVKIAAKSYGGMLNIGTCPTFDGQNDNHSIEVHILDFDGDLYSKEIEIGFVNRIREEMKFPNAEELQKQLRNDEQQVRKILNTNIND